MEIKQGSSNDAVFITLRNNGVESDSSEVVIKNFHSGARAEMVYRIHNATGAAIRPELFIVPYADVADYSKADGAVKAPEYMFDWVQMPELTDVNPGQIKDFVVALEMPKDAKKPPKKVAFQVGVASKTNEKVQPSIGIWWLVNMR